VTNKDRYFKLPGVILRCLTLTATANRLADAKPTDRRRWPYLCSHPEQHAPCTRLLREANRRSPSYCHSGPIRGVKSDDTRAEPQFLHSGTRAVGFCPRVPAADKARINRRCSQEMTTIRSPIRCLVRSARRRGRQRQLPGEQPPRRDRTEAVSSKISLSRRLELPARPPMP